MCGSNGRCRCGARARRFLEAPTSAFVDSGVFSRATVSAAFQSVIPLLKTSIRKGMPRSIFTNSSPPSAGDGSCTDRGCLVAHAVAVDLPDEATGLIKALALGGARRQSLPVWVVHTRRASLSSIAPAHSVKGSHAFTDSAVCVADDAAVGVKSATSWPPASRARPLTWLLASRMATWRPRAS